MPFPAACNCHGHAHDCYYDPEVDRRGASQNSDNVYQGGGVCVDCQHHTTGVNCERCLPGFHRDPDQPLDSPRACRRECGAPGLPRGLRLPHAGVLHTALGAWPGPSPRCPDRVGDRGPSRPGPPIALGWGLMTPHPPACNCESDFTDGTCEDLTGRCYCRPNFTGERCDACAEGFVGFPHCDREHAAGAGVGRPVLPAAGGSRALPPPQRCPPLTAPGSRSSRPGRS